MSTLAFYEKAEERDYECWQPDADAHPWSYLLICAEPSSSCRTCCAGRGRGGYWKARLHQA